MVCYCRLQFMCTFSLINSYMTMIANFDFVRNERIMTDNGPG